jgi:hypothetical protein
MNGLVSDRGKVKKWGSEMYGVKATLSKRWFMWGNNGFLCLSNVYFMLVSAFILVAQESYLHVKIHVMRDGALWLEMVFFSTIWQDRYLSSLVPGFSPFCSHDFEKSEEENIKESRRWMDMEKNIQFYIVYFYLITENMKKSRRWPTDSSWSCRVMKVGLPMDKWW